MAISSALKRLFAPAGPAVRRWVMVAVTVVLLGWGVLYTQQTGAPVFPVDDAYISLHNATALFAGEDPHFPGTPALVGSTSAVHVALTALFALVLPPLWAHWVVMLLGALAFALALLRLAFVLEASVPEALLMLAASLFVAQMPHQLLNGLETAWALAGLTWAIAASRDPAARRWELPVACGVLPFLRPELVAVSGLLMAIRCIADFRRAGLREALGTAGFFAAAALPWMVLYGVTTGAPYPNTIAAKQYFFAEGCGPEEARWAGTLAGLVSFQQSIGYFAYAGVLLVLSTTGLTGLVFAAAFTYAYYERFPGALGHYEQRYMYVFVPFLVYAVAQLFALRHALPRLVAAALFACCLYQAWPEIVPRWDYHRATQGFTRVELDGTAKWLEEHARGRKVLLHDAGYVGFFVDAKLSDMVGLKTPASVPYHRDWTWGKCGGDGRAQALHRITLAQQPDFIVVLAGWDQVFGITGGLRARGWHLEPRYERAYVVYEVGAPRPVLDPPPQAAAPVQF